MERDNYLNETLRTKLAQKLVESLWKENYAAPTNIDTLANAYLSEVLNLYHNQVVILSGRTVCIKTKK